MASLQVGRLEAQDESTTLLGVVIDAVTREQIVDVAVYIEGTSVVGWTNASGEFGLGPLAPGTYVLSLRKTGFRPRSFRFALTKNQMTEVNLDLLALEAILPGVFILSGTITDVDTGEPIFGVPLGLNGRTVAVTDNDGDFSITATNPRKGDNLLTARRIGYEPLDHVFRIADGETSVELSITLHPLAVRLAEIVVEADRTIIVASRLAAFYHRRRTGQGRYFTPWEIEKLNPSLLSDILRRVPGLWIAQDNQGNTVIRTHRGGTWASAGCSGTVVYLDGIPQQSAQDLDFLIPPDLVAGVEIYMGPAQIPPEYNTTLPNAACGVILIWTK